MYEVIDEHWNILTDDTEIRITKGYAMLSQKFMKYYSMLIYTTLVINVTPSLTPLLLDAVIPLNESRPRFFPVEVEFRVDKDKYFLPIWFYIFILGLVSSNVVAGVDSMHIVNAAHASSLFAIVSKQMENIILKIDNNNGTRKNKYSMNEELDSLSDKIIYREYVICLRKYQHAIKFVDALNSSYQAYALIMLLLSIGIVNMIGIQLIYVTNQVRVLLKLAFLFMALLCTLMITCYSGQTIMDESQNVFHGAYAAEWYKFSPRLKSLLIITLYRSKTPCELKAGNMIPLSIATYATVMRMSMSYYTTLLSI
ncbi:PREDICTED: odorant receptor 10a-like [Vollenhovia emeryi]|uniref:odorant receptor 10a-like n=1 Tax=Vollenhovia emeryi TaxID=411798 RepID=UPI0005F56ECA|nr:PREDICTED: odorant receptor 10a-like [Vollenhovia emeryi]